MSSINNTTKIKRKLKTKIYKIIGKNKEIGKYTIDSLVKLAKKQSCLEEKIKISVIVPNYNYEEFLIRRLYSILNQTTKLFEIIILDDCSKDSSRELIDKITSSIGKYVNIKKVYNISNSGGAFNQWCKGIQEANGDYIWIAEADDYCDRIMLEELLKMVKNNEKIYIAYVDTAYTDKNGNIFLKSIKPEIDILKTGHWNMSYVNNGLNEISNYSFLNNTIANVSSCIIKKDDYTDIYKEAIKYRQAGDWIFYLNIMAKGNIAFVNKVLNYYRIHDTQITSNMDKKKHLEEIKMIYKYIDNKFGTNDFQKQKRKERIDYLKQVWKINEEREE